MNELVEFIKKRRDRFKERYEACDMLGYKTQRFYMLLLASELDSILNHYYASHPDNSRQDASSFLGCSASEKE